MLHHKANRRATCTAAKAVIGPACGTHIEGGRLLIMKGAQAHPVRPGTAQLHRTPDERHDIRGGEHLVDLELDPNFDVVFQLTGQWTVANAGNNAVAKEFIITLQPLVN